MNDISVADLPFQENKEKKYLSTQNYLKKHTINNIFTN